MITFYDYAVIGFFFAFMIGMGIVFHRRTKDTSNFFRGGGAMTWWMVGASCFVSTFSAWTFVGLAGAVYSRGTLLSIVYLAGILGHAICMMVAPRFRRMRVITWVEALRERYGKGTEQFYANFSVLVQLITGGSGLYILGVFMSALFGTNMTLTIITIGVVMIFLSTTGGSWAIIASNFVQGLIIISTVVVTGILVLGMPEVGGLSGFFAKVPSTHWRWGFDISPTVLTIFLVVNIYNSILNNTSLSGAASRLLAVKNESHAIRTQIIPIFGCIILPIFALIPPLAATFLIPDINQKFATLNHPNEAAYVGVAMLALPQGLLGLLACSIFAATMTSLDVAINGNAGIFVKNIYQRIIRPHADERELMIAAKCFSVFIGVTLILGGIGFSYIKDLPLYELGGILGSLLAQPLLIPLVLGIFIRRVPSWSAMTTVILGFIVSVTTMKIVPPPMLMGWFGFTELNLQEKHDLAWLLPNVAVTIVCISWFLFTRLFYKEEKSPDVQRFFDKQKTPIDLAAEGIQESDGEQARTLGKLCLIYGGVTCLGMLIPNPLHGRIAFLAIGGTLLITGGILAYLGWRQKTHVAPTHHQQSAPLMMEDTAKEPVTTS